MKRIVISKALAVLLLLCAFRCDAEDLNIPLVVHEALREGVSGIDRKQEPVTLGIPFPEGMVYEQNGVPQLALEGAGTYQFRTLKKWPGGSVKWALIDFQTDVKSNNKKEGVSVVKGAGNSPGNLAEDKNNVIYINTGLMNAEIKKKGFNLFDFVAVDGKEIISRGASKGIVIKGENGREFLASSDSGIRVLIEENGPVRAVIKAEGTHMGNDKRMMDYTVRMHFYKGKSKAKVVYTLRNASKSQVEHAYIRSLDLVTKVNKSGNIQCVLSTHKGVLREQLVTTLDELIYYQAVSDYPQEYGGDSFYYHAPIPFDPKREESREFVQEGYWIKKGSRELIRGKKEEYADLTFLDISDDSGMGVTAGIRFGAGWWPKSLRAYNDGTIDVSLWPKENEAGYWIRYGSHNTFEILYDFHGTSINPAEAMKKFQYPLVAKAPVDWYNRNVEGIYPLYHFVSFKDERAFAARNKWSYAVDWRKPKMKICRYYYWGWGGFLNQHDFARISLVNFLRETEDVAKAGEYYLNSDVHFNYNADWAVFHSDDYDSSQIELEPKENNDKAVLAKVNFEIEHMHWYGLPLYYYLTGDERIKDAVQDFSDTLKGWAKKSFVLLYERFYGWEMYSLAAMYDFTDDASFMTIADKLFQNLLNARYNAQNPWSNIFISWNRGFIMRGENELKPFMIGYIIFDGLYNYYLKMDEKDPLKEKAADVLEGLSDFMYREPYFEGTKGSNKHWAYWLTYIYDTSARARSQHSYQLIMEAFYANLAPYLFNGESKWIERMEKIIRQSAWDEAGVWGGFGYMDYPGLQSLLYQLLYAKKDDASPPAINNLTSEIKGGNVILNWTVPLSMVRYQIKHSSKKLVEALDFDPDKRAYRYDPAEYANWWAGENIADEPLPEKPGTRQTHILKGLKPGHYYFAIRGWDSSNNRSKVSNLAEVEIK